MATPVNTFASGVELTPDGVEINEHGNAILEKNLTVIEKAGLAKIKQSDTAARLVPHFNWITKSPKSCLSKEEKTKAEEHEHPLLASSGKGFMVNVTGDGNCAYSSAIASLKHARRTQPGQFKGKITCETL